LYLYAVCPAVTQPDPTLATSRNAEAAVWLLQRGASPSAALHSGSRDTALHLAAAHGRLDLIKVLLAHGANYHAKNSQAQTPAAVAHQARHTAEAAYLLDTAKGMLHVPDRQAYSCLKVTWEWPEGYGPEKARAKLAFDFTRQQAGPVAGLQSEAGRQRAQMPMLRTLEHAPPELTGNWDASNDSEVASQRMLQQLGARRGSGGGRDGSMLGVRQQSTSCSAPDIGHQ
jgi:hypothetical protein